MNVNNKSALHLLQALPQGLQVPLVTAAEEALHEFLDISECSLVEGNVFRKFSHYALEQLLDEVLDVHHVLFLVVVQALRLELGAVYEFCNILVSYKLAIIQVVKQRLNQKLQ